MVDQNKLLADEGLEPLEEMTPEIRKTYTEEQNRERARKLEKIIRWAHISDKDMFDRILKNPDNLPGIAGRQLIRQAVLGSRSGKKPTSEEVSHNERHCV